MNMYYQVRIGFVGYCVYVVSDGMPSWVGGKLHYTEVKDSRELWETAYIDWSAVTSVSFRLADEETKLKAEASVQATIDKVLDALKGGPLAKSDIVRVSGLSAPLCKAIVDDLIADDLAVEVRAENGSRMIKLVE